MCVERSGGSETQGLAQIVESAIDVAECHFHRAGMVAGRCGGVARCGEDRPEQTSADLYQQCTEADAVGGEPIAAAGADAFGQRMGAQLAQVIAELTEGVVLRGEAMPRQHAFMQLAGGPVAEQAAGVEQAVEQADDAVIVQLDDLMPGTRREPTVTGAASLARAPVSMVESSSSACCSR